jgi:hypothetical protein
MKAGEVLPNPTIRFKSASEDECVLPQVPGSTEILQFSTRLYGYAQQADNDILQNGRGTQAYDALDIIRI